MSSNFVVLTGLTLYAEVLPSARDFVVQEVRNNVGRERVKGYSAM